MDWLAALNIVSFPSGDPDPEIAWTDPAKSPLWPRLLGLFDRGVGAVVDQTASVTSPVKLAAAVCARGQSGRPEVYAGGGFAIGEAVYASLAEAAEGLSTQWHADLETVSAPLKAVRASVVAPNELMLFSAREYARPRQEEEEGHGWREMAPAPVDDGRVMRWVEARSIVDGRTRLVPAAFVYTGYPGDGDGPACCVADSNGCAAGESEPDAMLRGLLELVERDALAIWWRNRIGRPALDLPSLGAPEVELACAWARSQGRRLVLHDLSHDLGARVVAAVSWDDDGRNILLGAGAALDPAAAARAAVREVFQIEANARAVRRRFAESGAQDLSGRALSLLAWLDRAAIEDHPFLLPVEGPPSEGQEVPSGTADSLRLLSERLTRAGIEPMAVTLTRESIGVPVVRMVAPGLRHHRMRLAPGRLYDVPVKLGWRPDRLAEDDLNREPIPL